MLKHIIRVQICKKVLVSQPDGSLCIIRHLSTLGQVQAIILSIDQSILPLDESCQRTSQARVCWPTGTTNLHSYQIREPLRLCITTRGT